MNKLLQEKFISVSEPKAPGPSGWVSDRSARDTNMSQPRHATNQRWQPNGSRMLQTLPPGTDICEQDFADITPERMAPGGLGSGTQATEDVTVASLRAGFDRKKMRPTDDQETHEHESPFYFDAEVDGVLGFVERGNVCDRE